MTDEPFDPATIDWHNADAWPTEIRDLFRYAAKIALVSLTDMDKKMLDVQITNEGDEPITMLFAIGDRAGELRQAWRSVYALHNDKVPREPTA